MKLCEPDAQTQSGLCLWKNTKAEPTSDADAGRALLTPGGVDVKDAAVTAAVVGPHPPDGDGAGVPGGGGELHVGLAVADAGRGLVGQERHLVPVEPTHLVDDFPGRQGDVAGERGSAARLNRQAARRFDLT